MFCGNCGKEVAENSEFCGNCGKPLNNDGHQNTTGTVKAVFTRQNKFVGSLVPMYIYIDKQKVATLNNGATVEVDVACGTHSVIVDMWSASSERQVEFSAQYSKIYIEVGIKMGLITNKAEIMNIKNEE